MVSLPVLALLDFGKPFVVELDVLGQGLGMVLMQDHKPITYFSHALNQLGRKKYVYERELMAIVFAVQKWRHYLLGRKFVVQTNQKMEQQLTSPEYQRWMLKLMGFQFEIQYCLEIENKAVDSFSRISHSITPLALTVHKVI